jgi:plasmid stabilization system protein ParE
MKGFVLTPPAQQDLAEIKRFLRDSSGPEIARSVLNNFRRALALVDRSLGLGHVREDLTNQPLRFWPIYYHPGKDHRCSSWEAGCGRYPELILQAAARSA